MPIPKTKAVLENGKALASYLSEQIRHIPDATTPNYVMSTSAAALFGLIGVSSSFDECYTSYLALAGCLLSAGIAVNQFGLQRTTTTLKNSVHSLFASKPETNQFKDARENHPLSPTN